MGKIFKRENLKPLIVLVAIAVVATVLVATVHLITAPILKAREMEKIRESLSIVLPGLEEFEEIEIDASYPSAIKSGYKSDVGYAFEAKTQGKEAMTILCGVDNDGKLIKIDVITESETPDYKALVFPNVLGDNGVYNGKGRDELEPEIYTGATLTSNGIYNAVKASLDAYTVATGGELEGNGPPAEALREESEILSLAAALVADSTGFTKVEVEGVRETLAAVYKENSGKGYVAYVVVMSSHYEGQVESEELIYIGKDGKIRSVEKLTWKTSDEGWGFVPPAEDVVDEFYGRIPGNDSQSIDGVDLITGATNTSTAVINSIKEALAAVDALIAKEMPTPEDELLSMAATLLGTASGFDNVTPDGTELVKRVYKDKSGLGYVAYVVVMSSHYEGQVESEELVYIGNDGKIKGIRVITWKTSDEGWGFVPPAEDVVDEFYGRIPGNDSQSIDGVDLITGATNTSTAVINSIKEALATVDALIAKEMPTPEDELLSMAATLVGSNGGFDSIPVNGKDFLRRVYRDRDGNGYVAYVVVMSSHYEGQVESEELVYIGNDGKIKGIRVITWKTSDEGWGFVPPAENVVDEFYGRIPGNDSQSIDGVELITKATNTSTAVINSIKEALYAVDEIIIAENAKNPTPRIVGIVISVAFVLVLAAAIVSLKRRRGAR